MPRLNKVLTAYINNCERCAISKQPARKVKIKMKEIYASKPLELLCIDFTKLDKAESGKDNVLVMVDAYSKYTLAIVTKDQTAKTISRVLIEQ